MRKLSMDELGRKSLAQFKAAEKQPIMVMSPQSPIGEAIFQKKRGDSVTFRGKEIKIIHVL